MRPTGNEVEVLKPKNVTIEKQEKQSFMMFSRKQKRCQAKREKESNERVEYFA